MDGGRSTIGEWRTRAPPSASGGEGAGTGSKRTTPPASSIQQPNRSRTLPPPLIPGHIDGNERVQPLITPTQPGRRSPSQRLLDEQEIAHLQAVRAERPQVEDDLHDVHEAFALLRRLPEDKAIELLRYVRASRDPIRALSTIKANLGSAIERQLLRIETVTPEHLLARNVLPPTRSRLEIELMLKHPNSYLVSMPLNYDLPETMALAQPSMANSAAISQHNLFHSIFSPLATLKPYCDQRLQDLDVTFWTEIPLTKPQAAALISLYLETDHPVLGFFDADLFIGDLVAHRTDFCSKLLVNAVLSWACQGYSAIDNTAAHFSRIFLTEAMNLWKATRSKDSILTVAATSLLCLECLINGRENYAAELMGQRLRLFSVSRTETEKAADRRLSPDWLQAISHVAWGTFNWLELQAHFYGSRPALVPPEYPIPGYDEPVRQLPSYVGRTFPEVCRFRRIYNEVVLLYNDNHGGSANAPLRFAELKFHELLAWADGFAESEIRGDHNPHHVRVIHIWYHTAVMDLFRLFLGRKLHLRTFTSDDATPEAVFASSLSQLKHLAVQFRTSQPTAIYCILWHVSLLYVANAVVRDPHDPDWRFYFMMCVYGYQNLFGGFYIVGGMLQGLLYMAVQRGALDLPMARRFNRQLNARGAHHLLTPGNSESKHKLDLDLAVGDHDAAQIAVLARKMEEMDIPERGPE